MADRRGSGDSSDKRQEEFERMYALLLSQPAFEEYFRRIGRLPPDTDNFAAILRHYGDLNEGFLSKIIFNASTNMFTWELTLVDGSPA